MAKVRKVGATAVHTANNILEAGIELISLNGEAGLRVTEVAERAGVSVGTIYTHFDSRDGLVEAIFTEQYRRNMTEQSMPLHNVVGVNCTREDLVRSLEEAAGVRVGKGQAASSVSCAEVIGAARNRPNLAMAIALENKRISRQEVEATRQAQDLGLIDPSMNPETLVMLIQGMLFGRALLDVGPDPASLSVEWQQIVRSLTQKTLPKATVPTASVPKGN